MERIIAATNNKGKLREIREILGGEFEILSLSDAGIDIEVEETGVTFLENALLKARAVYDLTGLCALGDDSGLCVNGLHGAPGVYSARYAGERCGDAANNALLLENMRKLKDRGAKFVCHTVLYYGDDAYIAGCGETDGVILSKPDGENGFGYDPLFYSPALKKTFAAAAPREKNEVSHRRRALNDLMSKLKNLKG